MFSRFVFSRVNIEATTGFTTASTVPLPRAKMKFPTYSSQNPVSCPASTASFPAAGSASTSGAQTTVIA